ncbi:Organic hydroperoxide resistance transcriptional regulator [Clostridiaceae bacterium JG1575]|nr:Organic hydroperoxide resistance transcriptional regulator [Clostridiaceae bacterium JG1575]
MPMDGSLKLENQLCFAVYALSREITKMYRPFLEDLGLTYTQYLVMLCLWEEDGLTLKQVGTLLNLDSGTLTPVLKKMEKDGVIRRQRALYDERILVLRLTEDGAQLVDRAAEIPAKMRCRIPLSEERMASLREELKDILLSMREPEASGEKVTFKQ